MKNKWITSHICVKSWHSKSLFIPTPSFAFSHFASPRPTLSCNHIQQSCPIILSCRGDVGATVLDGIPPVRGPPAPFGLARPVGSREFIFLEGGEDQPYNVTDTCHPDMMDVCVTLTQGGVHLCALIVGCTSLHLIYALIVCCT